MSDAHMIVCPTVSKQVIRGHYDLTTVSYRLLWGQHIHHGLWADATCRESPRVAQLNLARPIDKGSVVFLDRFGTILQAYRTGAMRYGCFLARKSWIAVWRIMVNAGDYPLVKKRLK